MSSQESKPNQTLTDRDKALMDVRTKAVGFAIDWSKHLATLATGTVVVSGTFLKDLLQKGHAHSWLILLAWGCLILSLIVSSLVVGALITVINNPNKVADIDVYSAPVSGLAVIQATLLFAGLISFVVFVSLNFS